MRQARIFSRDKLESLRAQEQRAYQWFLSTGKEQIAFRYLQDTRKKADKYQSKFGQRDLGRF